MTRLQITSIIRERGQLTIPETIRRVAAWASPLSVVTVSVENPNEITIKPGTQEKVDWGSIWNGIRLARSFRGKDETKSARELINEDRALR
jgi:bifunctional DNA-binding transcriptional regulator/antitoxin component of YhaV-PrlF toxin-antitoxin module